MEESKICTGCKLNIPLTSFSKCKKAKDGLAWECKGCWKIRNQKHYQANPEKEKLRARKHREENPEKHKAATEKWRKENPERHAAMKRDWNARNSERVKEARQRNHFKDHEKTLAQMKAWKAANVHLCRAHGAKRMAAKKQATVSWANKFYIEEIYHLAKLREKICGGKWHVDHIVPLQSDLVCGLHCEANLQVIPGPLNQSKKNYWWPDMP